VTPFSHFANRAKRSLQFRARALQRQLKNSLKAAYTTEPVKQVTLAETGAVVCTSKAELLQSTRDCTLRFAPGKKISHRNLHSVMPSPDCKNRGALERSLSEQDFQTPDILFGRFHDCIAEPRTGRLLTPNSDLVLETSAIHDILDPDFVDSDHLVMKRQQICKVVRNYAVLDEDVLFAFNSFTPSYGHYLLTSLPVILAFEHEIKSGRLKLVVPASFPYWMRRHLGSFGLADQHFIVLTDAAYRFRSAIVSNILDASNTRAPNPQSLDFVDRLRPASLDPEGTRLYVRRSGEGDLSSRTILNEGEIIAALEAFGFYIIEPGRMTLKEQARAFSQAQLIVSPHGSTLANLLFCQPGTKVLDLMPDDWVGARGDALRDVWGMRVCSVAGLEYSVLLCPSGIVARHYTGNPKITCTVPMPHLMSAIGQL